MPVLWGRRPPLYDQGEALKIIALMVMAALASGCERDIDGRTKAMRDNDERLSILDSNRRYEEAKSSGENCLKRGGLIVRSSWDGRIVDCK